MYNNNQKQPIFNHISQKKSSFRNEDFPTELNNEIYVKF